MIRRGCCKLWKQILQLKEVLGQNIISSMQLQIKKTNLCFETKPLQQLQINQQQPLA